MKKLIFTFSAFLLSFVMIAQNNSLDFDGTDDFVSTSNNPITLNVQNFTAECWIKYTNAAAMVILEVGTSAQTRPLEIDDTRFRTCLPAIGCFEGSTTTLNDGNWHHIAVVGDASNVTLYVDGVQDGQMASAAGNETGQIFIGGLFDIPNPVLFYDGQVDDMRIWSSARTQSEIQTNMNTELTGTESDLVAYYKFDGPGTACNLVDCNANENHGTFQGSGGSNNSPQFNADIPTLTDVNCGATLVACMPGIPTMGEWALITLGLIILSMGLIYVMRWKKTLVLSTESASI